MGFAAGNAQHIGARPQQQDAFGFSDPGDRAFVNHGGFLGVVADGVGGLTHGSEASQSAVRAFLQAYHLKSPGETIPEALASALREANAAVLRVASAPSAEGAGTTLVAAVLHNQSLYWISAGDSRIYLLNGKRLTRVTSDHVYAHELDEQAAQGLISRDEAQNNSERGSLTSYLGQPDPKHVDRNTRPLGLRPDDCVILCSDGFYRALNEPEIVEAFRNDLQKACDTLVRQVLAKQRKQQDNLTVIALRQSSKKQGGWLEKGGTGSRLRVFAVAAMVLFLLSLGARYWYEKQSANTGQSPQTSPPPVPPPVPTKEDSAPGEKVVTKTPDNPPPVDTEHHAATKAPRRKPKSKSKGPSSTPSEPDDDGSPQPGSSQQGSSLAGSPPKESQQGSPQTSPSPTQNPVPGQTSPKEDLPKDASPKDASPKDATVPPPTQPPDAHPTPPNQTAPPTPVPANNQDKPPAVPPAAPDNKPNTPQNLALNIPAAWALLSSNRKYTFRVWQPGRALGTKDGDPSCHS